MDRNKYKVMSMAPLVSILLLSCSPALISCSKVIFLVVDGLTPTLLDRVSTPAIDFLREAGASFSVTPGIIKDT